MKKKSEKKSVLACKIGSTEVKVFLSCDTAISAIRMVNA